MVPPYLASQRKPCLQDVILINVIQIWKFCLRSAYNHYNSRIMQTHVTMYCKYYLLQVLYTLFPLFWAMYIHLMGHTHQLYCLFKRWFLHLL